MTKKYLEKYNFPDTYVFTKNLAECYLEKHRGDLRICILRPSVIISTYKYPFPGWTDTVSAAGIMLYPIAMGWLNTDVWPYENMPADFIPSDYVTNGILIAATYAGATPTPEFNVFNCSSTTSGIPIAQEFFGECARYLKKNPWPNQTLEPSVTFTTDVKKVQKHMEF